MKPDLLGDSHSHGTYETFSEATSRKKFPPFDVLTVNLKIQGADNRNAMDNANSKGIGG